MKPITDDEVSGFPLGRGRQALLEAITGMPPEETGTVRRPRRRRASVTAGIVAATAAAVAAVPIWIWAAGGDDRGPSPDPILGPSDPGGPSPEDGRPRPAGQGILGDLYPVVRELPDGWRFSGVDGGSAASVSYVRPMRDGAGRPAPSLFQVAVRSAEEYDATIDGQVSRGARPAGAIDVDNRTATAFENVDDPGGIHQWTALTPVENGYFVAVIAAGQVPGALTDDDWRRLVAAVDLTGREEFEASLPEGFLVGAEAETAIEERLSMVTVPEGFEADELEGYRRPGALDSAVVLAAACAWVEQYRHGAAAEQEQALVELERVEEWPLFARLGPGLSADAIALFAEDLSTSSRERRTHPDAPDTKGTRVTELLCAD